MVLVKIPTIISCLYINILLSLIIVYILYTIMCMNQIKNTCYLYYSNINRTRFYLEETFFLLKAYTEFLQYYLIVLCIMFQYSKL